MTDKDKQTLARADMIKLQGIERRIKSLADTYEEIRSALYGTGIDYSKDHVQVTPTNTMESIICDRLAGIRDDIDNLIDEKNKILFIIHKMSEDKLCNVLIDKYIHNKSFRELARLYDDHKTNIERLEKKALTDYHNTKCSINSNK